MPRCLCMSPRSDNCASHCNHFGPGSHRASDTGCFSSRFLGQSRAVNSLMFLSPGSAEALLYSLLQSGSITTLFFTWGGKKKKNKKKKEWTARFFGFLTVLLSCNRFFHWWSVSSQVTLHSFVLPQLNRGYKGRHGWFQPILLKCAINKYPSAAFTSPSAPRDEPRFLPSQPFREGRNVIALSVLSHITEAAGCHDWCRVSARFWDAGAGPVFYTTAAGVCSAQTRSLFIKRLSQTALHRCMNNRMFCSWWAAEDTATLHAINATWRTLNTIQP